MITHKKTVVSQEETVRDRDVRVDRQQPDWSQILMSQSEWTRRHNPVTNQREGYFNNSYQIKKMQQASCKTGIQNSIVLVGLQ